MQCLRDPVSDGGLEEGGAYLCVPFQAEDFVEVLVDGTCVLESQCFLLGHFLAEVVAIEVYELGFEVVSVTHAFVQGSSLSLVLPELPGIPCNFQGGPLYEGDAVPFDILLEAGTGLHRVSPFSHIVGGCTGEGAAGFLSITGGEVLLFAVVLWSFFAGLPALPAASRSITTSPVIPWIT